MPAMGSPHWFSTPMAVQKPKPAESAMAGMCSFVQAATVSSMPKTSLKGVRPSGIAN